MSMRLVPSFAAPLVLVLIGLATPLALAASTAVPPPGASFVVLTPPWQSAAQRVAAIGGVVLAQGRLPFLALTMAHSDTMTTNLQAGGPVWFLAPAWENILCS